MISSLQPENSYQKAEKLLIGIGNQLLQLEADFLKKYELTSQQHNMLQILKESHPDSVSVKLIKQKMPDKMSDVSRIVEKMRKKGLLERKHSETDRRAVGVSMTGKGLSVLYEIMQVNPALRKSGLQNLSSKEVQELIELLEKV
ncbi:MAG: MarR family multiple gene transcriptional regulator MgrA [Arenicella sp.]|jgi:MarR family multiple gene transcriptional regulator MgrA